jgi:hypothetical protein
MVVTRKSRESVIGATGEDLNEGGNEELEGDAPADGALHSARAGKGTKRKRAIANSTGTSGRNAQQDSRRGASSGSVVPDEPGPSGRTQSALKGELQDQIKSLEESLKEHQRPSDYQLEDAVRHGVRTVVLQARGSSPTFSKQGIVGPTLRNSQAQLLALAYIRKRLLCVFGIELVESTKAAPEASKSGQKLWLARSALPLKRRAHVEAPLDAEKSAVRGLAFFLAELISLEGQGEGIAQSVMWDQMKKHGARHDDSEHPQLGNVREVVYWLKKCHWIVFSETDKEDPKVHLGESALALLSPDGHFDGGFEQLNELARSLASQEQHKERLCCNQDENDGEHDDDNAESR